MADDADNRVAVYIDFDNIVISRYNQLYGRKAFQDDNIRNFDPRLKDADQALVAKLERAVVDIGAILDYSTSFGTVVLSRAYADWSQTVNANYRNQLVDRAIDLTQMFPLSATKNGADIRLAVDVIDDLFRLNDVTHVVLVAGDSDYVALAQRVQRLGRFIVGIGVAGATSKSLPAACNEFRLYDDLPGIVPVEPAAEGEATSTPRRRSSRGRGPAASEPAAEPVVDATAEVAEAAEAAPEPVVAKDPRAILFSHAPAEVPETEEAERLSPRAATKLLRRALELGHAKEDDDEWLHTSAVKQQMRRMDPSFHEKSLGYSSFSDFVKSRNSLAELDKESNGQKVRLRASAPASEG